MEVDNGTAARDDGAVISEHYSRECGVILVTAGTAPALDIKRSEITRPG
jgi:hypothetical protein